MSAPDFIAVVAAARTLSEAGWSINAPALERLRLTSISQAAEALAFDRKKVAALVARGEFPGALRIDGDVRIPVADIGAFLARQPRAFSPSELRAA